MPYNLFKIETVEGNLKQRLDDFIFNFGQAISRGNRIPFADNDINYAIKLQYDRIKEKGLDIEFDTYKRGVLEDVHVGSRWTDTHYDNMVCFKDCGIKRTVTKNGNKLFSDDKKLVFYETLTDVSVGMPPVNDSYCCPNCAAITTIGELVNGCPYCGTHYKMDDLFPKITGYNYVEDIGRSEDELKPKMKLFIIIFILIFVCIGFFSNYKSIIGLITGTIDRYDIIGTVLYTVFCMVLMGLMGAFLGYLAFSMSLLFGLIGKALETGDKMGTIGSRKKFERKMRILSPEFSFEYFTSKAVSLIKTAVFSKDEQELVYYKGERLDPTFKDIIDLNFGGALGVVSFKEKNGIATVVTDVFFDILYAVNDKIIEKHRVFRTTFSRRTDMPIDYNFSITKIQCPTCAASFDATRTKTCPHCGNIYDIADSSDWAITEMKVKKGHW